MLLGEVGISDGFEVKSDPATVVLSSPQAATCCQPTCGLMACNRKQELFVIYDVGTITTPMVFYVKGTTVIE